MGGIEKRNDGVGADTAGVVAFHCEITVFAEVGTPTVADYPLLLGGLAYDCYSMVERVFWTVSEGRFLFRRIFG